MLFSLSIVSDSTFRNLWFSLCILRGYSMELVALKPIFDLQNPYFLHLNKSLHLSSSLDCYTEWITILGCVLQAWPSYRIINWFFYGTVTLPLLLGSYSFVSSMGMLQYNDPFMGHLQVHSFHCLKHPVAWQGIDEKDLSIIWFWVLIVFSLSFLGKEYISYQSLVEDNVWYSALMIASNFLL